MEGIFIKKIIKWIMNKLINIAYNMICNFMNRWNMVLATLIPIIIYTILRLLSDDGDFQVRVIDLYVISMSLLLSPIFDLFFRFYTEDTDNLTLKKFRSFIKTKKLISSVVIILFIVMLMAFDKSYKLFDLNYQKINLLYSSVALLLLIMSFYLLDLYDDKKVHQAIRESSKSSTYNVDKRERGE